MLPKKLYTGDYITWDFVIAEQLKVSRYGHRGAVYFKQFTPYGIEAPDAHPPQRIDARTYEMARRLHEGRKPSLAAK